MEEKEGGLFQAMTAEEKSSLFEAIDYHEEAEEGTLEYPKRFVKLKVGFKLAGFTISILDDQSNAGSPAPVLRLALQTVRLSLSQRPAASNFRVGVTMESLTVFGVAAGGRAAPRLVTTVNTGTSAGSAHLLNFAFETNPPADPEGDLETPSFYARKLSLTTSPLEIVYDTRTVFSLVEVFRSPEEVRIDYLQETAIDNFREYKDVKMTQIGWEYARDNHVFFDVDIKFESSYFIFPKNGEYYQGCPALVANLGSVLVKSKEVTEDMKAIKAGLAYAADDEESKYDQFNISLTDMELLLSQEGENWRKEMLNRDSKLFLLKPIDLEVSCSGIT